MHKASNNFGFTLIELLIVVAIIAILAAIAIPNFLAAQVRSKVARVKGNMRSTATALESYYVDNNGYPWIVNSASSGGSTWFVPPVVTTPVAYITTVPDDVFNIKTALNSIQMTGGLARISWKVAGPYSFNVNIADGNHSTDMIYPSRDSNQSGIQYVVFSVGPGAGMAGQMVDAGQLKGVNYGYWYNLSDPEPSGQYPLPQPFRYWYDPTNGTVSLGYVIRQQGGNSSP